VIRHRQQCTEQARLPLPTTLPVHPAGGVATTLAEVIAEMARRQAASMSPDELVALFAVTAPEVAAALQEAGPFPIAEVLSIAVLVAVVHGLDLCAAVGAPAGSIPRSAMDHTVELLASLAEPVAFVEAATGRSAGSVLPVLR